MWSPRELEYLSDNIGIKTTQEIAKVLRRPPRGIRLKAIKRGYLSYNNFYSASLLSKELGICRHTIVRWYKLGILRGKVAGWKNGYYHPCYIFLEQDIVGCLRRNHNYFRDRNIPNRYFSNIVKEAE